MEEKELFRKINEESENNVPNVYDKIVLSARAEGLFDGNGNTEAYSDGETVALGGTNKKAVAITMLSAVAAISLAIALPIALSGKYNGGGLPPLGNIPLGENYAVGAVAAAKLCESFLDETQEENGGETVRSLSKSVNLVVNPDENGIERYISEFDNYYYACNSFFGEKPAYVELVTNDNLKYDNSVIVKGRFSNGDEARYAMYYTEARVADDTTVSGDEVKYYLEGEFYLNYKRYSLVGERIYTDSTKEREKSLSLKAYPINHATNDRVELSVKYGTDGGAEEYSFTVVKGDKTVSESVLNFPVGSDAAYRIEFSGDDGERDGKFTVNRPKTGWGSLKVGYQIGDLTSEFHVKATASKLERVLAPDGLIYTDLGDGTYAISGYDKNDTLPEELILPNEFEGKKIVKITDSAFSGCRDIRRVSVSEGITSLGTWAFNNCVNLEIAVLPNSLTQIKNCAFSCCESLKDVVLPENIESIGRQTFYGCKALESVNLPNNLKTLDDDAFYGCSALKTLSVPASVEKIGYGILSYTALENISVDADNGFYFVDKGCLLDKATKSVLGGVVGFEIPDYAGSIAKYAFYGCKHFTELTLPASVKSVGSLAFDDCGIENIVLNGVETIDSLAFANSALKNITFSENLTFIGSNAFIKCYNLSSLDFPASLKTVGSNVFESCYSLESITVAEGGSTFVGSGNCLIDKKARTLVLGCKNSVIPDDGSILYIGNNAFAGQYITELNLPSCLYDIGSMAFWNCPLINVEIPQDVRSIGYGAFSDCTYLESVLLPQGLEAIDSNAFDGCESLKNIQVPARVENIGDGAFSGCLSLEEAIVDGGANILPAYVFKNAAALIRVNLSDKVTDIGEQAFYGCQSLAEIVFGGTTAEWNAIQKSDGWDWDTGDYVVVCSDGTLAKDGTVLS